MTTEPASPHADAAMRAEMVTPPYDPSANVLQLVAAETKRQDDLREALTRYNALEVKRQDDLRDLTSTCQKELSALYHQSQRDQAVAEAGRIDALLQAMANNVALASEKTTQAATTLANQVAATAEASRTQVSGLATTIATQTQQMREALERRLTLLEQSQYSIGGRDTQRVEGRQGNQWVVGVAIGGGIGLLAILVTIAIFLASNPGG